MSRSKQLRASTTYVADFDPKCPCGNYATHLLSMHAVDYCRPRNQNIVEWKCNTCLEKVYEFAHELVDPAMPGMNYCAICHLRFDNLSDIIVSLWPIPKGKGREA